MARSEQGKSARLSRDWTKKRSGTLAPISLEDLMEKEVQSSTQDGAICELSVLADPTNEQSTKIKWKIRILDHPNSDEIGRASCSFLDLGMIQDADLPLGLGGLFVGWVSKD